MLKDITENWSGSSVTISFTNARASHIIIFHHMVGRELEYKHLYTSIGDTKIKVNGVKCSLFKLKLQITTDGL